MVTPKKNETAAHIVDASKYRPEKAGVLEELVAASVDGIARTKGNIPPRSPRFSSRFLILIGLVFIAISFSSFLHMLNVQDKVDLLGTDLEYEELVARGREIARTSAIWFYCSAAAFGLGLVFIGSALLKSLMVDQIN